MLCCAATLRAVNIKQLLRRRDRHIAALLLMMVPTGQRSSQQQDPPSLTPHLRSMMLNLLVTALRQPKLRPSAPDVGIRWTLVRCCRGPPCERRTWLRA